MTVKNRIETAPAAPMMASADCLASAELIEYHRCLAEGEAGIVTVVGLIEAKGVDIRNDTTLTRVDQDAVRVEAGGRPASIACDSVLLCLGMVPDQEMADRFIRLAPDVILVGDGTTSQGNVWTATTTAFNAAVSI